MRVMNEYGVQFPIWYQAEPEQIRNLLAQDTVEALISWARYFDLNFDHEVGWAPESDSRSQYEIGLKLARAVKAQLPPEFQVQFVPWEHKKRTKRIR